MKKILTFIIGGLATLIIVGLVVFVLTSRKQSLPPQEVEDLRSKLSPIAQNFFDGMLTDDYEKASKNFNGIMREKMPPEQLATVKNQLYEKIGGLVKQDSPDILKEGNEVVLQYKAEFEKEKNVTIRLVFNKENDGYKISGLWFDSPKLRK